MYKTIVRALLSCVLAIPFLGCEDENDSQEAYSPRENVEELIWDTTGGGDLKFSVVRQVDQFKITVERSNFQPVDEVILLTNADLEAYQLTDDIFSGGIDIHDHTFVPSGPTGTKTAITLVSPEGQAEEIENIRMDGLSPLYDFVRDLMEQAPSELTIDELIWDTTGASDLKFSIVQGSGHYEISVQRYDFQTADEVILLTNTDLEVYELVDDIFSERIDIHDHTFVPNGPTGTWTTITLVWSQGQAEEIENIRVWGLSALSNFVRDYIDHPRVEATIEELIWDTTGGGDLKFSIVQGPDQFEVSVQRYNFQVADQVILLTNADLEVYELVDDIFSERIDIHDYAFVPAPGTGGGSQTTITLAYSEEREDKVEDISSRGGLSALYDFVSDDMNTSE